MNFDVAGSSAWTKEDPGDASIEIPSVTRQVQALCKGDGLDLLSWAGDGGTFANVIDDQSSYETLVYCAIELNEKMAFIRRLRGMTDRNSKHPRARIIAHSGGGVTTGTTSLVQSEELDDFAKHERDIGIVNAVVVTEEVHRNLGHSLQSLFRYTGKTWTSNPVGGARQLKLFVYPSKEELFQTSERPVPRKRDTTPTGMMGEQAIVNALREQGYSVVTDVVVSGLQLGILATRAVKGREEGLLVEYKDSNGPVGVDSVLTAAALRKAVGRRVNRLIIISRGGFSHQALAVSRSVGIDLITLEDFLGTGTRSDASLRSQQPLEAPEHRKGKQLLRCFVAMPSGKESNDLFYHGLVPALHSSGFSVERADVLFETGNPLDSVRNRIGSSDLVIADVTGANPNVMLEVGLAQAFHKRFILIAKTLDFLPSDISAYRILIYRDSADLSVRLSEALRDLGVS